MSDVLNHARMFWDLKWLRSVQGVKIRGAKLTVLTMLLSFADWTDWTCFPSYAALAKAAGITEDTAQAAMRELITLGLVERVQRREKRRTNMYVINVAVIHDIAMRNKAEDEKLRKASLKDSARPVRSVTPDEVSDKVGYDDENVEAYQDDDAELDMSCGASWGLRG